MPQPKRLNYITAPRARALTELLRTPTPLPKKAVFTHTETAAVSLHPWCLRWNEAESCYIVWIPGEGAVTEYAYINAFELMTVSSADGGNWFRVNSDGTDVTYGIIWGIVYMPKAASAPTPASVASVVQKRYIIDVRAAGPNMLPQLNPDYDPPVAIFSIAYFEEKEDTENNRAATYHKITPNVYSAISLGSSAPAGDTFVPGYPEIILEGGYYFEQYYFARVTVIDGVPKMEKLVPAVPAYRVPVTAHSADHSNGLITGTL